jgi:hypothetical protein
MVVWVVCHLQQEEVLLDQRSATSNEIIPCKSNVGASGEIVADPTLT